MKKDVEIKYELKKIKFNRAHENVCYAEMKEQIKHWGNSS